LNTSVIFPREFYSDGRGPSLVRAFWDSEDATTLVAIEYRNPDARQDELKHVRFFGVQVAMFTPEEVIGAEQTLDSERERPGAAMNYGRSDWLQSFNQQHLSHCDHYKLLFYDDMLDLICESIEFSDGLYRVGEVTFRD
jgi:hypothetical protein